MPKRRHKQLAMTETPTQQSNVGEFIAPYVASLPVVQPVIKYFFFNQLPSKYWGQLIKTALDKKLAENNKAIEDIELYKHSIAYLTDFAKKTYPPKDYAYRRNVLRYDDKDRYPRGLIREFSIIPFLPPFFFAAAIFFINYNVSQGTINKNWAIEMVPDKNYERSRSVHPASFFAFFMMAGAFFSFILCEQITHAMSENICVEKSLPKLQLELNKLMLYPEARLNDFEKQYRAHIQGRTRLSDPALHELLKKVIALEKGPWLRTVDDELHPFIKPSKRALA